MTAQGKRAWLALLFVGACIALPVASAVFVGMPQEGTKPLETAEGPHRYVLKNYSDSGKNFAIDLYEHLAGGAIPNGLPSNFTIEFFDPAMLGAFDAYSGEGVVGLYWPQVCSAPRDELNALLAEAGWQHIGATETSSSYIKENGAYRWLNMMVIETDDVLGAVLNFREDV